MTGWNVLAGVLLGAGTLLIGITGLGMLRLPDVYNRMNAVAKAASLGLVLILLGVLTLLPSPRTAAVVTLAVLLQVVTAPVGGYALARAAYLSGAPMSPQSRFDALAEQGGPRSEAAREDRPRSDVARGDRPRADVARGDRPRPGTVPEGSGEAGPS